ncbi:MAG: hypothetical protein M5U28_22080 [Sandaracinaceae bacterium]|nr:hypothetical protein [Sandaracinaceae bacterium]
MDAWGARRAIESSPRLRGGGHNIQKSRAVELGAALSRFVRELS